MRIEIKEELTGSILDIGGGGECVIGRIYGNRVIAIDNSREELEEVPDCCEKRLMDATELTFPDQSFDHVTFFYSLMYMTGDTQKKAIREALRVLRPGGTLVIWDSDIRSAYPDPYIIDLEIVSGKIRIQTTYGIVKDEAQEQGTILGFLKEAGQHELRTSETGGQFCIRCRKA